MRHGGGGPCRAAWVFGSYARCSGPPDSGNGDRSAGRGASGDAGWRRVRGDDWEGVEEVATGAREWLRGFLLFESGIPTVRTSRKVFRPRDTYALHAASALNFAVIRHTGYNILTNNKAQTRPGDPCAGSASGPASTRPSEQSSSPLNDLGLSPAALGRR